MLHRLNYPDCQQPTNQKIYYFDQLFLNIFGNNDNLFKIKLHLNQIVINFLQTSKFLANLHQWWKPKNQELLYKITLMSIVSQQTYKNTTQPKSQPLFHTEEACSLCDNNLQYNNNLQYILRQTKYKKKTLE